jgi:LPXTG-site transpeptidase (sortase) family protein
VRKAFTLAVAPTLILLLAGCTSSPQANDTAAPSMSAPTPASPAASSSPVTLPSPSFLARSIPLRITIPKISVHSNLMQLGLKKDGTLQVPPAAFPAGWYTGAPTPGQQGPAVIVGHIHWNARAGVFARLAELKQDDQITVLRTDGKSVLFEVTSVKLYAKSHFPTALVYGNVDDAELRLITCGGYDKVAHKYEANLVVFARVVS